MNNYSECMSTAGTAVEVGDHLQSLLDNCVHGIKSLSKGSKLVNSSRNVAKAALIPFHVKPSVTRGVDATRLFALAGAPFLIYKGGKHIYKVCRRTTEGSFRKVFKTSVKLVEDASHALGIAGSTIMGLDALGAVSAAAANAAGPILGVGMVLSGASVALGGYKLYRSYKFKKLMGKDFNVAYHIMISQGDKALKKQFKVDGKKLKERLKEIYVNGSEEERKKAISTLRGRITAKQWCYSLSMLSGTVALVGGVIFLVGTPKAAPAGFALMGASALTGVSTVAVDAISKWHFKRKMGL